MYNKIKYEDVKALRERGLSWNMIGKILGINKGVAYRIYKNKKGENIGNRRRISSRQFIPQWEQHDWWEYAVYIVLPKFLAGRLPANSDLYYNYYDYILNLIYTINIPNKKYFWSVVRNALRTNRKKYFFEEEDYESF